MLFNSYIFIFLFLPLALALYFGLNYFKKYNLAMVSLLLMSMWFYGYFNKKYLVLLISSIVINWLVSKAMHKLKPKKLFLILGLVFNVGLIFYFKYYGFFISNINHIFSTSIPILKILLPLGISFFTFQQISYIVDSYKEKTKNYTFLQYALFVSYFPQLVAGPIVLHDELIPQFTDVSKKTFNSNNFANGLYVLAIGLFKKIIVADSFGIIVDSIYAGNIAETTSITFWVAAISYTFQIYFDFSGYSDMAIGLGKMFNFELPINFNSPYKATSIPEFWTRWHITLSRFLREYIYYPLGGNRKGTLRTFINIFIVFIVSGVWHGANWTFIIWGMLHGIANIFDRVTATFKAKLPKHLNWATTFLFLNLTWVIFRSEDIKQALFILKKMVFFDSIHLNSDFLQSYVMPKIGFITSLFNMNDAFITICSLLLFVILFVFSTLCVLKLSNIHEKPFVPTRTKCFITSILYFICIMSFSSVTKFLYFNF